MTTQLSPEDITVDPEDAHYVHNHKWYLLTKGSCRYARKRDGSFLHRLILPTPPGMVVDHINGDGLDNRKANLRIVSRSQNQANMRKPTHRRGKPCRSPYKGTMPKPNGSWASKITKEGKQHYIGSFPTEIDAAQAYNYAAWRLFGEFAHMNEAPDASHP